MLERVDSDVLRGLAALLDNGYYTLPGGHPIVDRLREASDEIDRLRAQLDACRAALDDYLASDGGYVSGPEDRLVDGLVAALGYPEDRDG